MLKWIIKQDVYTFIIEKRVEDETVDLTISFYGGTTKFWFPSYRSARYFLRKEYYVVGRMKKVSS